MFKEEENGQNWTKLNKKDRLGKFAKIQKFKWDILDDFQTLCTICTFNQNYIKRQENILGFDANYVF